MREAPRGARADVVDARGARRKELDPNAVTDRFLRRHFDGVRQVGRAAYLPLRDGVLPAVRGRGVLGEGERKRSENVHPRTVAAAAGASASAAVAASRVSFESARDSLDVASVAVRAESRELGRHALRGGVRDPPRERAALSQVDGQPQRDDASRSAARR